MSHLVCTMHGRRIMFITNKTIHRSDSTECPTPFMKAGKVLVEITDTLRKDK